MASFEKHICDSAQNFKYPNCGNAYVLFRSGITSHPVFKDEPATLRGAFLMLAGLGRVIRATVSDLSREWGVHERKAARMVATMERRGLISVSGSGRCRLICIESDLVQTCGFHVMPSAAYPTGPGAAKWRGSAMPSTLRSKVLERDGNTCQYCGATDVPMHVDHIKPVAKGGTDALKNLTTACAPCNLSKGDKLLSEWRGRKQ